MNTNLVKELYSTGKINAKEPRSIYSPVPPIAVDTDKVEGMLLGVAIGDALGGTSEWMSPDERYGRFGFIDRYVTRSGEPGLGLPTDDTQLTFDTIDVILDRGYLDGAALAKQFVSHDIFGIGSTVSQFVKNYVEFGYPWYESGVRGGVGNGALMRISAALIPSLKSEKENLVADTILDTMITHNSPMTIGTTVAFTKLLRRLMAGRDPRERGEMTDQFAYVTSLFTGNDVYRTKSTIAAGYEGSAPDFLRMAVSSGLKQKMSVSEFGEKFGSGLDGLDTAAVVLFILEKHLDDPDTAVLKAVNHTLDNDTVGAIVGAAMGARYGKKAFRAEWINDLSGRTRTHDDGAVFKKIAAVKKFLR